MRFPASGGGGVGCVGSMSRGRAVSDEYKHDDSDENTAIGNSAQCVTSPWVEGACPAGETQDGKQKCIHLH